MRPQANLVHPDGMYTVLSTSLSIELYTLLGTLQSTIMSKVYKVWFSTMYIRHLDECSSMNKPVPPIILMLVYRSVNSKLNSIVYSAFHIKVYSMVNSVVKLDRELRAPKQGIGQHCLPLGLIWEISPRAGIDCY